MGDIEQIERISRCCERMGYIMALRDISAWVSRVALNPAMDHMTLAALNAEIQRLGDEVTPEKVA